MECRGGGGGPPPIRPWDEISPLVIGFLVAQKAFDVLGHDSVIRKLYLAGIVGKNGILSMNGIRNLYPVLNGKETTLESNRDFSHEIPQKSRAPPLKLEKYDFFA
jgi:hypothetical protein